MNDKRKYQRYACDISTSFDFFDGDPETIDTATATPEKGAGRIVDLSAGGAFLVTESRVPAGAPIILSFTAGDTRYNESGSIVRTGLLKNNPSEVARRFAGHSASGSVYIAVNFNTALSGLSIS